jgi:C_GCAxxG_C_C family probable redox protein
MNELFFKMVELSQQGFLCSQILCLLALEEQEKENPDLIRAMSGLIGGLGFCGKTCGALTGGTCLIGLYAGKGSAEEMEDSHLNDMLKEFVNWFEQESGAKYGGTDCTTILENNPVNRAVRCPQIVQSVYEKVMEILAANGYSASGEHNCRV